MMWPTQKSHEGVYLLGCTSSLSENDFIVGADPSTSQLYGLITLRFFARNLQRGNRRRNIFACLTWDTNTGFKSDKPTQYLIDYGDGEKYMLFKKIIGGCLVITDIVYIFFKNIYFFGFICV